MHEARVLVVDDSAAMRALFSDILEQVRDVRVVGTAASAAEAREQIEALRPNVVTLDVEMPGMSGIEFLEEIMATRPLPVVMLSGLTQSGTETSLRAYELGAVECFPKPLKATPEQFTKTVGKLGKIVLAAANSNVRSGSRTSHARAADSGARFQWNGRVIALSASMGGIDALTQLLAGWPAHCPPTLVCLQAEQPLIETFVARLDADLPCNVKVARDGVDLAQGAIYVSADQERHLVLEPGNPARMRLVARDPIEGARPSANLLLGSLARTEVPAAAAILSGMGQDGVKGLKMLRDAGADTFVQEPATATFGETPAAALDGGAAAAGHGLAELSASLLAACAQA